VIQSDKLVGLDTVIVCPFTTSVSESVTLRPIVEPDAANGLRVRSQAMVEKLTAFRLKRVATPIGHLGAADLARLDQAIRFVLDLYAR
jgi:mRNA interferase MazF